MLTSKDSVTLLEEIPISSDEIIDAQELKTRLIKKFNITKENVTQEDIIAMLNKINFDKSSLMPTVEQIFQELDTNKSGNVKTEEFAEILSRRKSIQGHLKNMEYEYFCNTIREELIPNSERIISKLKKIKNKAYLNEDKETVEDIDWIIKSICDKSIYEPELSELKGNIGGNSCHFLDYVMKYSRQEEHQQKENDLLKFNKSYASYNEDKSDSSSPKPFQRRNQKRKGTNLGNLVSPSVMARLSVHLNQICSLDFNIFEIDELIHKKSSFFIALEIFNRMGYIQRDMVDEDQFKNFANEIIDGYDRNIIYHNDIHAGDVMQTVFYMLTQGDIPNKLQLNEYDTFSVLAAALCHDYKHTGQSNSFHINSKTKIALRYNDVSVLENFHVAQSFKVLMKPENNIMSDFSPEQFRLSRRRIIDGILATDMANHSNIISNIKTKMETFDIKKGKNLNKLFEENSIGKNYEIQQCLLNLVIHSSDISGPGKSNKLAAIWMERIYEEFFTQGDLEKKMELPVSLLCDRMTTNVNKSQIGYINFIVAPTFEILSNFFTELGSFNVNIKKNLRKIEEECKKR